LLEHYGDSFRIDPELVVHLFPENLHHHKQLAKLQGEKIQIIFHAMLPLVIV
jgi:hypothetical protein